MRRGKKTNGKKDPEENLLAGSQGWSGNERLCNERLKCEKRLKTCVLTLKQVCKPCPRLNSRGADLSK